MIIFFLIEIQIYENSNQGPLTKESNEFTCVRVCLTFIWLSDTPGRILRDIDMLVYVTKLVTW